MIAHFKRSSRGVFAPHTGLPRPETDEEAMTACTVEAADGGKIQLAWRDRWDAEHLIMLDEPTMWRIAEIVGALT